MRRCQPRGESRAGFTLLEIMMAVVLMAIVIIKAHGALSAVQSTTAQETREVVLEDQARRLMRRIAYEIMGANRETLVGVLPAPASTDDVLYSVNLGIQDGEVVWSDPEQVALEDESSQVFWSDNPGSLDERRVVWSSLVAPYLEGELPNGMDDNGNGLIDEKGLSFTVDRNAVHVRLTLERVLDNGERVSQTVETVVTCRNRVGGGA